MNTFAYLFTVLLKSFFVDNRS